MQFYCARPPPADPEVGAKRSRAAAAPSGDAAAGGKDPIAAGVDISVRHSFIGVSQRQHRGLRVMIRPRGVGPGGGEEEVFDPAGEHRWFCPWIHACPEARRATLAGPQQSSTAAEFGPRWTAAELGHRLGRCAPCTIQVLLLADDGDDHGDCNHRGHHEVSCCFRSHTRCPSPTARPVPLRPSQNSPGCGTTSGSEPDATVRPASSRARPPLRRARLAGRSCSMPPSLSTRSCNTPTDSLTH